MIYLNCKLTMIFKIQLVSGKIHALVQQLTLIELYKLVPKKQNKFDEPAQYD